MTSRHPSSSRQRVLKAFRFERPDTIPRFDSFYNFDPESLRRWTERLGPLEDLTDMKVRAPREGAFLKSAAIAIRREGGYIYDRDTWGRTIRRREGTFFAETVATLITDKTDLDALEFDPPDLDERYARPDKTAEETLTEIARERERYCLFGKTGGPFLRSCFLRGETDFLMEILADPERARTLVEKVADLLIGIAAEQIRRWSLQETGVMIYDDMGSNAGPLVSPDQFEQIFLPAYRRMVAAYKDAGATYVLFHSDGNVRPLLEMLVDAGIDGINPIEPRAGMDVVEIRRAFPRLILTGGMDNSGQMIRGAPGKVSAAARRIIEVGRDGGVIIGAHSINPEIPLENFTAYHETCAMQRLQ